MTDDDNRPWKLVYRVSYWRKRKPQPIWEVFGSLTEARHHARKVARFKPHGPGGPVLRVELEERIVTNWHLLDRQELVDTDTTTPPDSNEAGGESQPGGLTMNDHAIGAAMRRPEEDA